MFESTHAAAARHGKLRPGALAAGFAGAGDSHAELVYYLHAQALVMVPAALAVACIRRR